MYKNIYAFKLEEEIKLEDIENIEKIKPMSASTISNFGWGNATFFTEEPYYQTNNGFLLNFQEDKKSIPGSLVKMELDKVIKEFEKREERKAKGKEKKEMKEHIISKLAETAFIKSSFTEGYIDNKNMVLVINTASDKGADNFIALLRKYITLKISLIEPDFNVSQELTKWVTDKYTPEQFSFGSNISLIDINDSSESSYKNQDLLSEEVEENISNGKIVSVISLVWQERYSFSLNSNFRIKGLQVYDSVKENIMEDAGEDFDAISYFESEVIMMMGDFYEIITDLINSGTDNES